MAASVISLAGECGAAAWNVRVDQRPFGQRRACSPAAGRPLVEPIVRRLLPGTCLVPYSRTAAKKNKKSDATTCARTTKRSEDRGRRPASALNRLVRSGAMPEEALRTALRSLDALAASWLEVLPSDRVRTGAMRLLRIHSLGAADSLQLSACLAASDGDPSQMVMVCADQRLREAGDREGLMILA